jgi:hypothetical protein
MCTYVMSFGNSSIIVPTYLRARSLPYFALPFGIYLPLYDHQLSLAFEVYLIDIYYFHAKHTIVSLRVE